MRRTLVVEFTKMNGAGNDFIVIDNRFYHFSDSELRDFARRWCPRQTGIGADGVLAMNVSDSQDYRMRYINADGSLGTMCGNGARCLARFARMAGVDHEEHAFESDAGVYRALVPLDGSVRLYVPGPERFREDVRLMETGSGARACYIWTGTEHAVVMTDDVAAYPVAEHGPSMRRHPALGDAGANIDFVEVSGPSTLTVRTFEKGVEAETLACGTGAIASALVALQTGAVRGSVIDVIMPGGTLHIGIEGPPLSPRSLYLEGPADAVFRGTVEIAV